MHMTPPPPTPPPTLSPPSTSGRSLPVSHSVPPSPVATPPFLAAAYRQYIASKNHQGLALLARQFGVPPELRQQVWPLLLRHHPFVAHPYVSMDSEGAAADDVIRKRIDGDLKRYIRRSSGVRADKVLLQTELEVMDAVAEAVVRFVRKWGQIVTYHLGLVWVGLGLAEWMPPVGDLVLVGRGAAGRGEVCVRSHSEVFGCEAALGGEMQFADAYERLVLVLLHVPEKAGASTQALPVEGGTVPERLLLFVYLLRRLLPELLRYLSREGVLSRVSEDDEWILWWIKWGGAKVWLRWDRAAVWDRILGFKGYEQKGTLEMSQEVYAALGEDPFWYIPGVEDAVEDESDDEGVEGTNGGIRRDSLATLLSLLSVRGGGRGGRRVESGDGVVKVNLGELPCSTIDPLVEVVFLGLAMMKAKEPVLVELDQDEIREFLLKVWVRRRENKGGKEPLSRSRTEVREMVPVKQLYVEAGAMWRAWLEREVGEGAAGLVASGEATSTESL